jgi:MHS family alpha-ketoglutarate permease-like MFS transporter
LSGGRVSGSGAQRPSQLRQIFGGAAGNLVEWYDWYAYSAFALYFGPRFFPPGDDLAAFLNTAAIFAVGFLMRPIGSWLLGVWADRRGRKSALTLSVAMMCAGSLLIAVAPTYDEVGLLAPALLLIARLVQGLSVGGEYGASATFMSEVARAKWRGFLASFQYVTLVGGQLLALALLVLLQGMLDEAALKAWGWRIPFVVGAACAVLVFWLRSGLVETEAFERAERAGSQGELLRRLLAHPKELLIVLALTAGGSLWFYTFTTYMQKYLVLTAGWSKEAATSASAVALFAYMLMQPLFGALSDLLGRRALLLMFGVLASLATVPALDALGAWQPGPEAILLLIVCLAILSCYTAISGVVKAEMFPADVRALGVGMPYALGVAIFGGSAEYVALAFKNAGFERGFFWYVTVMALVALTAAYVLPDPKRHSRIETD